MPITVTYWDDLSRAEVEAALKDSMRQYGKAWVRQHPMPGYIGTPPLPEYKAAIDRPKADTTKLATYTPERVLREWMKENDPDFSPSYFEKEANNIIERLKKYGFEITLITKPAST